MDVIAFIWVIAALGVGLVASTRGRGSGTWFVIGLLLSPLLAVVLLFAMPNNAAAISTKTHHACPACAEQVLRAAVKCKHCGGALTPAPYIESTWDKLTKMR